jgi:hypothetical protein
MIINWPLMVVLFCLAMPGVFIVMPRLVSFLLPDNTGVLKKRVSRLVIFQAVFMVLVMSFIGSVLSAKTGLNDPILEPLLQGKEVLNVVLATLIPVTIYALTCFIFFSCLYYGVIRFILDEHSFEVMTRLRAALKLDGCLLYGGVVEELIGRWGLMNLIAFFSMLFTKHLNNMVIFTSIVLSGLLFAIGQIPVYLAAGCLPNHRFVYSLILLSLCQSLFFGVVFWQYGLVAAMMAHILFHLFWAGYDKV